METKTYVVDEGTFTGAANSTDPEIYTFPTLRDTMAMAAASGILANAETRANTPYYVADEAYKVADAMLLRRKEP